MSGCGDGSVGADESAAAAMSVDVEAEEELTTHLRSADEFAKAVHQRLPALD